MNLRQLYVNIWARLLVFVGKNLSSRMKRIVFLTSLPARLKETNKFDDETLTKLNRVMSLGKRSDALEISIFLSKAVWCGQGAKEILGTTTPANALAAAPSPGIVANIISNMPSWLRYGDDEEIKEDVMQLLKSQDAIFSH